MALKHVNAVIVGAGAGGGVVAKELAAAGLSVVLLERGQVVLGGRLPQGRPAQPAHHGAGRRVRSRRRAQSARAGGRRGRERVVDPSDGGYSNNAACVGGGTFSYGAHGVALHGEGFPHALHLRRGGRQHARRLAHQLRRSGALLREGRVGDRRLRRRLRQPLQGAAPQAAAHAAAARRTANTRSCEPAAKRLGLHPFDIPMLRNTVPYNGRRACMRCRWCVGFACEVNAKRHAQHRDSRPRWPPATASCAPSA